jgi:hypothetical protein
MGFGQFTTGGDDIGIGVDCQIRGPLCATDTMPFTMPQASGVCAQIFASAFVRKRAEGDAAHIAKPARMASLTSSGAFACMIKCINATLAGKSPRSRRLSTSRSATETAAPSLPSPVPHPSLPRDRGRVRVGDGGG